MDKKTNYGLVEYAKAQLGKPYWFGTFGQIANSKVWSEKAKQYPKYYSDKRKGIMKSRGDEGQKVHDCLGLWKGYMMSKSPDMPAIYDKTYDYSADSIFSHASEKGTIDTLPDIAGIGLYKKGHFGVYIGGGQEIEARGFDYGVLQDAVKNTAFTHWFKIPHIEYQEEASSQPAPEPVPTPAPEAPQKPQKSLDEIADEIIRGDWGNGSERVRRLTEAGYDAAEAQKRVNEKLGISVKPAPQSDTWTGIVNTRKDPLRVRAQKSFSSTVVRLLPKGSKVELKGGDQSGFFQLADGSGYVASSYIQKI